MKQEYIIIIDTQSQKYSECTHKNRAGHSWSGINGIRLAFVHILYTVYSYIGLRHQSQSVVSALTVFFVWGDSDDFWDSVSVIW